MNTVLTVAAFAVYCAFLGILLLWVPRLDLIAVVGVSAAFTAWDLFAHRPPHGSS